MWLIQYLVFNTAHDITILTYILTSFLVSLLSFSCKERSDLFSRLHYRLHMQMSSLLYYVQDVQMLTYRFFHTELKRLHYALYSNYFSSLSEHVHSLYEIEKTQAPPNKSVIDASLIGKLLHIPVRIRVFLIGSGRCPVPMRNTPLLFTLDEREHFKSGTLDKYCSLERWFPF